MGNTPSDLLSMPTMSNKTENTVQDGCRLLIQKSGGILLRNNSGAMKLPDGRFLRWGLGNDSTVLNKKRKSSDLIGPTPMLIKPHHVGRTIGVFTAIECKPSNWVFSESSERDMGQLNFMQLMADRGSLVAFINDEEQLIPFVEKFIL